MMRSPMSSRNTSNPPSPPISPVDPRHRDTFHAALTGWIRLLVLCLAFVASRSEAYELQILQQAADGLRFRVIHDDLQVIEIPGPVSGDERCRLRSAGALFVQRSDEAAYLTAVLEFGVPARGGVHLRHLETLTEIRTLSPPPPFRSEGQQHLTDFPEPGLHLLDRGWTRGQRIQRLRLDLAVYEGENWRILVQGEYELRFTSPQGARIGGKTGRGGFSSPAQSGGRVYAEGPVFRRLLSDRLLNAEQARAWQMDPALQPAAALPLTDANPVYDDERIIRIMVSEDAAYRVDYNFLQDAGIDPAEIDPHRLALWRGDVEQPLYMVGGDDGSFDPGDFFVFIGRYRRGENFPTSYFSPENAYFLTWHHGTGLRFVQRTASPQAGIEVQEHFRQTRHLEQDAYWNHLEHVEANPYTEDHWYWRPLSAVEVPATHDHNFDLVEPVDGGETEVDHIRFCLRGNSSTHSTGVDHHIIAWLNQAWVGDMTLTGQDELVSSWFPVSSGLLQHGRNTVDFMLPLDHGNSTDLVYLNWIDVEYLRRISLDDGQLFFPLSQLESGNIRIGGLSGEFLLALCEDGTLFTEAEIASEGSAFTAGLHLPSRECEVVFAELQNLLRPDRIVVRTNPHLRDGGHRADMLIISTSTYMNQLTDLVDYHDEEMQVELVHVEDIYNEFGEGLLHTRTIRDFLRYTLTYWQTPAPSYVLFVGKSSRANHIRLVNEPLYRTQVPCDWVHTAPFGATATDEEFTYLVGLDTLQTDDGFTLIPDRFQDILAGRISVVNQGQLADFLEKHRQYRELEEKGEWMETQVHVADSGNDYVFEVGNQAVAEYITPDVFPVAQLHVRTESPWNGGALDFIDLFNQGCTVLNYNGHGAIGVMSSSSVFRATDIRFLSNQGKYPINFAWSCLVGYFDDPDTSSMAELLLRKDNAGSIAFYGAAAKAYISADNPFMANYFANHYDERALSFGQIVHLTESTMQGISGGANVIQMYNLMGDPALVPALPKQRILADRSSILAAGGEELALALRTEPPGLSGDLRVALHLDADRPVNMGGHAGQTWEFAFEDSDTVNIQIPDVEDVHLAALRFSMNTAEDRAVGHVPLFLNLNYAGVGSHSPDPGQAHQALQFQFVTSSDPDSVLVKTNFQQAYQSEGAYSSVVPLERIDTERFRGWTQPLLPPYGYNYGALDESWINGMPFEDLDTWPNFRPNGLFYRFHIYDGEPYTDVDGNGAWDPGEPYEDENENGQWDPAGEPLTDLDGDGAWDPADAYNDTNLNGQWDPEEPYEDDNENGQWDEGETYEDLNENGQWDAAEELYTDENGNGLWDPAEPFQDWNDNGLRDGYVVVPGGFVRVNVDEGLTAVDSLLRVTGNQEELYVDFRWMLAANSRPDRGLRRLKLGQGAPDSLIWTAIFSDTTDLAPGIQQFHAGVGLDPGWIDLRFQAGPVWVGDSLLSWLEPLIFDDHFLLLTPAEGSGGPVNLGVPGGWALELPALALEAPLQLDAGPGFEDPLAWREPELGQPGLGLLLPTGPDPLQALDLQPREGSGPLPQDSLPGYLACAVPVGSSFRFTDAVLGDTLELALARWIEERELWVVQPGEVIQSQTEHQVSTWPSLRRGSIYPVALRDETGPSMETAVGGQWFASGDIVPREPTFQIHLSDPDGIDLGEGRTAPRIFLDSDPAEQEGAQFSGSATEVLLTWSPGQLEPGSEHELELEAADALGNLNSKTIRFTVSSRMELNFFANHPNPFADRTTFAWELTGLPTNLHFEIYTSAGRGVRRILIPWPRIGYDEYTWDGTDDDGRAVANGVYFLKMVVSGAEGSVEEIFKLARLR